MNKEQVSTSQPSGAANKMPSGIPYIIGNEAAERYSFYGMKAILVVFMTKFLRDSLGELDPMSDATATFWFHTFVWLTYLTPILGAFISDIFWGKYRTIIRISLIYILGHAVLALIETKFGLYIPLSSPNLWEVTLIGLVVAAGFVAGIIPAYRAYRHSLADGMMVHT